jgi:DNA helicase IV
MSMQGELAIEQKHFDTAWDARERRRASLHDAPQQAAGPRAAAAEIRRGAERALAELGHPDEPVAFGRFDLDDGEAVYVGKHLITNDERDTLVINWKVPYAEPYFAASVDDPCGIRLRRKFTTDRNVVLAYEEVVFEDLARRVGELTGLERAGLDDTVLRDLEKHRTGEMQDIVQTIHASQYQLVRSPLEQLLIIQGGPGTGKTAVALHRVSWLLFNHLRDLTPADVLVVGPNPTFTKYIKSVLPGLGDNEVAHHDLLTLGPQRSSSRPEDPQTARLKGDGRMAGLLERGLKQRARVPERMDGLDLPRGARLDLADLEDVLRRFSHLIYAQGRVAARRHLGELAERRAEGSVDGNLVENALERIWPSLTPQAFLRDLLGSRERLVVAAGDDFTAGDVNRLLRTPADKISEETWSDADVALLDEADNLITGAGQTYAHLVVDEAQDLSPMQLRSVRRRSRSGSMTVVGDLAQSTGPWARDSWEDVGAALRKEHPLTVEELLLGYRVPKQVFDLAAQLLPLAAPGIVPPRVVREGPEDPLLEQVDIDDVVPRAVAVAKEHAGSGRFVGIICPDSLRADLLTALQKQKVAFSDASRGGIGKSINVVSPSEAKGLEFDAVVVLEPERIVSEHDRGLRMLYVALTRTTQYLSVVHSGGVLPLAVEQQPRTDLLPPAVSEVDAGETLADLDVTEEVTTRSSAPTPVEVEPELAPTPREPETHSPEAAAPVQDVRPDRSAPGAATPSAVQSGDLTQLVINAAAAGLAESVRHGVPQPLWLRLVDQLRRELGVSDEELRRLSG